MTATEHRQRMQQLGCLVKPSSVILVGLSTQKVSTAGRILNNLRAAGFDGEIFAVHPKAETIDGLSVFPSATAVPVKADLGVVCVPAERVLDALRDLDDAGCRTALVTSAGFTTAQYDALREFIRQSPMLVHGPNNMGLINLNDEIPLWAMEKSLENLPAGNVGLIAQSGAACVFVARSVTSSRFSKVISSGSELGVSSADYLAWLAEDDHTDVIGIVLESIPDLPAFRHAVALARSRGKPIVVLKAGRSDMGARATQAHTGALIDGGDFYDALFEELDIAEVHDYDEFAATLDLLAHHPAPIAGDRPVAFAATTMSGGQCAIIADLASDFGLKLAEFSSPTLAELDRLLPGGGTANPVDVAGTPGAARAWYGEVLETILADPAVDIVLVISNGQSTLGENEVEMEVAGSDAVNRVWPSAAKPVVVVSSSGLSLHPGFRALLKVDAAIVRGFQPALVAVRALGRNRKALPLDLPGEAGMIDPVLSALRERLAATSNVTPALARDIALHYGLPLVQSHLAANASEAVAAADSLGYPVVVKVMSEHISHRSEIGGVLTGLGDADAVADAVARISASVRAAMPDLESFGFEVQSDLRGWIEVAGGFVASDRMGTLVRTGMGGQLVELLGDGAQRLAPFDADQGAELVSRTIAGKVLGGYRNLHPQTNLDEVGALLSALGRLGSELADLLAEGDLNPIMVQPGTGRARIVDLLLIRRQSQ